MLLTLLAACSQHFDDTNAVKDPSSGTAGDSASDADTDADTDADADADTGLPDEDHDGYDVRHDCDDTDPAINRGAEETWYDGVDSDCSGGSDFDKDQDGHDAAAWAGDDCDDENPATYGGAPDTWYDGIDSDCAGNDDYDQDEDGEEHPSNGGLDCDDTDPTIWTGGVETLDDLIDGDCDGAVDGARFRALDTYSGVGVQGPRIAASNGYVIITFIADTYLDPSTSTITTTGGIYHEIEEADVTAGVDITGSWYWDTAIYTFDNGLDFWANDEFWVWGYGVHSGDTRYLIGDAYAVADDDYYGTGWGEVTTQTMDDVEISEDDDGSLHIIGCDSGGGRLDWMHGQPSSFYRNAALDADDVGSANSEACLVRPDLGVAMASKLADSTLMRWTVADSLTTTSSLSGWNVVDMESATRETHTWFVAAQGSEGLYVELDGESESEPLSDAQQLDADIDSMGRMAIAVTNGTSTARLFWGDVTTGFTSVVLDTGLPTVDDIDVYVTRSDMIIVAARGGDDVSWAYWQGY